MVRVLTGFTKVWSFEFVFLALTHSFIGGALSGQSHGMKTVCALTTIIVALADVLRKTCRVVHVGILIVG